MRTRRVIGCLLALGMLIGSTSAAGAADGPDAEQGAYGLTPPRLSFAEGQVSFWRPGADDWATAQVNTPLAPGDELSTSSLGNMEIQIGSHAFVRGWTNTQIGLENHEPDFIQFKLTDGSAVFDLRRLEPGRTVEVDTPNAAFTMAQPGYYRVDVSGDRTSFITRRAGRATVIPAGGDAVVVTPSEELVIDGTRVASYVAPPPDGWDQWNYARTDKLLDAVSARYIAPDMYGVSDLDQYGTWRVVSSYGSVWVPTGQRAGWTPYSTGSWVRDPFYGWTWVDTAPWGWAPYHYGRWVFVDGYWGWAPGPIVVRPVYAPALVAFFGGGPVVGWVALGWGEPVVPWWGKPGFVHEPSWRGWGGPRVVNNVVVTNTTVVNVQNINVYRNAGVRNAVVVVNENRFGRGPITSARETRVDEQHLRLTHDAPQLTGRPASFVPTASRGVRPPEASLTRPVVATRPPRVAPESAAGGERRIGPTGAAASEPRLVSVPPPHESAAVSARPPFGPSTVERPVTVRTQPPPPPRMRPSRDTQVTGTPSTVIGEPGRVAAPPSGRRIEDPQATAPAAPTSSSAPRVTPPPRRAETPQVAAPVATPPSSAPVLPTPRARRVEPPQVATPAVATTTPPSAPATPPARRVEAPQVAAPAPSPSQPSTHRAPPPQSARAEGSGQPAPRLPGEPANRLAPSRAEAKPPQREQQ